MRRVVALVDGEHYPPTTRWGLDAARSQGYEILACLLVGGKEKLGADQALDLGAVPVEPIEGEPMAGLADSLARYKPEAVLDLADEPVLGYRERMELVAVALAAGVPYLGPDFEFRPPITEAPLDVPTLGVIGTGKRSGKTAIAGEAARLAAADGLRPVIVAMGRGGPAAPQVAEAGSVTAEALATIVEQGEHAASDYLEDALTTGLTTVGARRCGGGLAGAPFVSNVREAADAAVRAGAGLVILEGSGSAIPTVPWDAGVLVSPATLPEEYLGGYLGPFRLLLSDLLVLTMGTGPEAGPREFTALLSHVRRIRPSARVVLTEFKPFPLGDVGGKRVFFTTTAPESALPHLRSHLEQTYGCEVVGVSGQLADRRRLAEELDAAPAFDLLLTELKAAAVDVAARRAKKMGAEVVFCDNRAQTLEGDADLADLLRETARLALDRAGNR
jgi:cyclic 2,3-diphosphoglycerate synthetase